MDRVSKRIQQTNRNRLHPFGQQSFDRLLDISRLHFTLDIAVGVNAFIHFHTQVTLNQRWRLLPGKIIESGHSQRAQLKHIPKTSSRN